MGWASFTLADGREAGYAVEATCEHPGGCTTPIDRGLAYACGGMHGNDRRSCDRYICSDHKYWAPDGEGGVCADCVAQAQPLQPGVQLPTDGVRAELEG